MKHWSEIIFQEPVLISRDEARAIAQKRIDTWNASNADFVARLDVDLPVFVLFEAPLAEGDFGWVFGYQSEAFLKSGDPMESLAGNAPFLIARQTGKLLELGTAHSVETYVGNFKNFGHPHRFGGRTLQLDGFEKGADRLSAIKAIRNSIGCGLADAARKVELCFLGARPTINCRTRAHAIDLAYELNGMNILAKQLPDEETFKADCHD
ncbi:YrhB domain-containing protein [Roseibium album]|uniref:YrhB domain-containing protein n=1 Tax=Roseibium album TaxID=311410 RepID=UPI00391B1C3E